MVTLRIGQIMGPLWAASFLDKLPIMAAVNLFVIILLLVSTRLPCQLQKQFKPATAVRNYAWQTACWHTIDLR